MCLKLTLKTPKRRSGVFIVNFEHISHLFLVFLLLTLKGGMNKILEQDLKRFLFPFPRGGMNHKGM